MTPLAGALVGYLSLFLQCGIVMLVAGLAMAVRASLGRRPFDFWTLGLSANAAALFFLSVLTLGRVAGLTVGFPWVTLGYALLEDFAALFFIAAARHERGAPPFPRRLLAVCAIAFAVTFVAGTRTGSFFDIYAVHAAGFATLLAVAAVDMVRSRAGGIGARLTSVALAALALDYGHVPLLKLAGVHFAPSYLALESYATMALDIVLGLGIVVRATDTVRDELEARNAALAEAQRALHVAAFVDALCGVPNRAAFLERVARPPASGTVAMIDVDGLKEVNDRFGHAAGDAVLRAAASCLQTRCGGEIYRIGGDEFAGIWDAVSAADVRVRLAALDGELSAVESLPARARISWGVAAFGPSSSFADALIAADLELYDGRAARRA